jgi:hypothetical protein
VSHVLLQLQALGSLVVRLFTGSLVILGNAMVSVGFIVWVMGVVQYLESGKYLQSRFFYWKNINLELVS